MEVSSKCECTHITSELRGSVEELCKAIERVLVSKEDTFEENPLGAWTPCVADECTVGERSQRCRDELVPVVVHGFDDALGDLDWESWLGVDRRRKGVSHIVGAGARAEDGAEQNVPEEKGIEDSEDLRDLYSGERRVLGWRYPCITRVPAVREPKCCAFVLAARCCALSPPGPGRARGRCTVMHASVRADSGVYFKIRLYADMYAIEVHWPSAVHIT